MLRWLRPAEFHKTVWQVDGAKLVSRGVVAVLVDLDNTIVEYRQYRTSDALEKWIAGLKSHGLRICIVSNSRRQALAASLGAHIDVPVITRAGKPSRRALRRAMAMLGAGPSETAVIGDQVFTDILAGNRLGCHTILVSPLSRHEFPGTRLVRILERFVLRSLKIDQEAVPPDHVQ
ncbi:MAG: YqeG family HAD IIIA-type phosphatase [Bacillota bacterium]|nr:YqeG family HAD IIIA-type phosphatase [Bacillota bacterium]